VSRAGPGPLAAAVIVLAAAPGHATALRALEPVLGELGCLRLQRVLVARAARWAADVAPGRAVLGYWPGSASRQVQALTGPGVTPCALTGDTPAARAADACAQSTAFGSGQVVLADCALPTLRTDHARAAVEDLCAGCQVSYGPATEGGWYLAAASRPEPALLGLGSDRPDSELLSAGLLAARERGLRVGLLRSERVLDSPSAIRALLADPLCPGEVRTVLAKSQTAGEPWP